jgi:glycosyltransferase involved in cell wall biosynthesis
LIAYDIIPYSVEWDYLWTYQTARSVYGFSRKAAFRCHVRRGLYLFKLKLNVRRANSVLAISNQTAQEFRDKLHVPAKKLIVTPLGVNLPSTNAKPESVKLHQYVKTSWGYRLRDLDFDPAVPFILFVGGADKRRKLEDLVAAFNGLRAEGHNFKLILAGDSMQGPDNIATEEIQYALKTSSYLEDIIFMGFVDDKTRDWLYKTARAFIFPSRYEGFGLPVLEAMAYQCPVISYPNKATKEVAGDQIEYVNNIEELKAAILQLLRADDQQIKDIRVKNLNHAKKYSWNKTAQDIVQRLSLN